MENLQIHIKVSPETFLKDPNASDLGRKIVSASISLINELGFEAFTFKKLGINIGSPESSIYRYFESKHMLLIYLTYWYWSWVEYKLVFAITNIKSTKQRLEKAIIILTKTVEEDSLFSHINETLLDRVVMNEGVKSYHIKEIDEENEKGYFKVYKRVVKRVSDMILELNPKYKYPNMLVSTMVEGALMQRFFAEHLPALTNIEKGKCNVTKFYNELVFSVINLHDD